VPERLKVRPLHAILYQSLAHGANRVFERLKT